MSNSYDTQYQEALKRVREHGTLSVDRTGTGTIKVFDVNFNVDLSNTDKDVFNLPATTLRKVFPRIPFEELMWMLRGQTDVTILQNKNIHIWDLNSTREFLDSNNLHYIKENHIGKAYGWQMRNFNGIDQLVECYNSIRDNPTSRRHLISFWNASDLNEMALPPCHYVYNFMVEGDKLHLKYNLRSNDGILGQPTNAIFAALWLTIFAKALGYKVGNLATSITDFHVYTNHTDALNTMLDREPQDMAKFKINKDLNSLDDILALEWEDIEMVSYESHPAIDRSLLVLS